MNEMKGEKHVLYDVFVLEFLQEADLTNSGAWNAFILCFEPYFFQGDNISCLYVSGFVDNAIGTCSHHQMVAFGDERVKRMNGDEPSPTFSIFA